MDGLSFLAWIAGGGFLWLTVEIASAMHRPLESDTEYARIDRELDESEAFYDDLARNVGI